MNGVFSVLASVALLGGMVVVLLRLGWQLTLVSLGIVPVLMASITWLTRRIIALATDMRAKESVLWARAQRGIGAIRVTQAFTTEGREPPWESLSWPLRVVVAHWGRRVLRLWVRLPLSRGIFARLQHFPHECDRWRAPFAVPSISGTRCGMPCGREVIHLVGTLHRHRPGGKTYILPRYAPQPTRMQQKEGAGWCICYRATMQCTDPWRIIFMTCINLVLETVQRGDRS